jgi:hypothetical protein
MTTAKQATAARRTASGWRDARRGRNEWAAARGREGVSGAGTAEVRVPFFCECDGRDCRSVVWMTLAEYADLRRDSDAFVVTPGHQLDGPFERMVRGSRFFVVRAPA